MKDSRAKVVLAYRSPETPLPSFELANWMYFAGLIVGWGITFHWHGVLGGHFELTGFLIVVPLATIWSCLTFDYGLRAREARLLGRCRVSILGAVIAGFVLPQVTLLPHADGALGVDYDALFIAGCAVFLVVPFASARLALRRPRRGDGD